MKNKKITKGKTVDKFSSMATAQFSESAGMFSVFKMSKEK